MLFSLIPVASILPDSAAASASAPQTSVDSAKVQSAVDSNRQVSQDTVVMPGEPETQPSSVRMGSCLYMSPCLDVKPADPTSYCSTRGTMNSTNFK